jgi:predicted ABC-type ATPase
MPKEITVFAGPVGGGSEQIVRKMMRKGKIPEENFICKDYDIDTKTGTSILSNIAVQRAKAEILHLMNRESSIIYQTVFSSPEDLELLNHMKQNDWFISFIYSNTSNPEINIQRYNHSVPEDILSKPFVPAHRIELQYLHSLMFLSDAYILSNRFMVHDYSGDKVNRVLRKYSDIEYYNYGVKIPAWVDTHLVQKINLALKS